MTKNEEKVMLNKEDDANRKPCMSPEHNPPMHICLQPGVWTWTCPVCGEEQTIIAPTFTFDNTL